MSHVFPSHVGVLQAAEAALDAMGAFLVRHVQPSVRAGSDGR
jgi:hypothetical protein